MALKFSSDILDLLSCQYLGTTSLSTQHGGLINADLAFFMGNLLCNPEETQSKKLKSKSQRLLVFELNHFSVQ